MKIDLKSITNLSVNILWGITLYCGFIWFLGVGLASGVYLTSVSIPTSRVLIGHLVLVTTILIPLCVVSEKALIYRLNRKVE